MKFLSSGYIRLFKNKYVVSVFLFFLWILIFDENNWIDRMKNMHHLRQLEKDKDYYKQQIETDSERLKELKTHSENLEKFGREQFMMKKDNEDIFLMLRRKD